MRSETTGKVCVARWKMTEAEALARDPQAVRVPVSMEVRTPYKNWDTASMGLRYPGRN